jgi:hypothetical protein
MGDLRNKFRKQAEQEAIEAMQRAQRPPRAPEPSLRCNGCGRSAHEVPALYALPCERWETQLYGCSECLPSMEARPRPVVPKAQILCACGALPTWCNHTDDGGMIPYCDRCVPAAVRDMMS